MWWYFHKFWHCQFDGMVAGPLSMKFGVVMMIARFIQFIEILLCIFETRHRQVHSNRSLSKFLKCKNHTQEEDGIKNGCAWPLPGLLSSYMGIVHHLKTLPIICWRVVVKLVPLHKDLSQRHWCSHQKDHSRLWTHYRHCCWDHPCKYAKKTLALPPTLYLWGLILVAIQAKQPGDHIC